MCAPVACPFALGSGALCSQHVHPHTLSPHPPPLCSHICERHFRNKQLSRVCRLVEVVAASLARWADTYLMPAGEGSSAALAASFGAGSPGGLQAAQLLVSLVLAALTRYPGETSLHEVVCSRLLAALVRRTAVSAGLVDMPVWHSLCEAVGRGDAGLLQLAEKVQRRLLQSLLLAGAGWPGDAASWAGQLLESTAAQLRQLGASGPAARAALQRADGLHLVVSLLARLRGAVRGTLPCTQPAVFQQASRLGITVLGVCFALASVFVVASVRACMPSNQCLPSNSLVIPGEPVRLASCPCLTRTPFWLSLLPLVQFTSAAPALATLFDACRAQPLALTLVLKLGGEVVEQHAAYLSPGDANALCGWALQLLRTYSAHNLVRLLWVFGRCI